MYIAFKWLVILVFTMWLAMCILDLFIKEKMNIDNAGVDRIIENFKNETVKTQLISEINHGTLHQHHSYLEKEQNQAGLHFIMFLAGALIVTAFHNKQQIFTFAHRKIGVYINVRSSSKTMQSHLKKVATDLRVNISKYSLLLWKQIKTVSFNVHKIVKGSKIARTIENNKIHNNLIMLKKLKEMAEERKNLGQLLITALHENKNIRMRYELETMTKNRLIQQVEDTQKQMKENRSRFANFQQLYLIAHQENNYLKVRLRKLKQEKDESEKNLVRLIYEVYKSKNSELKAYCTSLIVKTKDNILNSDVNAEIKEFLESSHNRPRITHSSEQVKAKVSHPTCLLEIIDEDDSLMPLVLDEPKLREHPGEYVWTVKDKNGIIEKLYEYEFDSNFDNGGTIRRIRQYSVYYDKDCLLDFSKVERHANTATPNGPMRSNLYDYPNNQRIVTGSEAFKKFLQNNTSIVQAKPVPLLLRC